MGADIAGSPFFRTDKPWVRWWWFNQHVAAADIEAQLSWVSRQGFGGVEIAWVYPLPDRPTGQRWLSPEWTAVVHAAKEACVRLGLGCDFTFGSLWPFGDSTLTGQELSQWYTGPSPQRIDRHWESREVAGGPAVMNHLDRRAFDAYARRLAPALRPALEGETSCLFCDSWEVEDEGKLWSEGLGDSFFKRFGYRIEPFMPVLAEHPEERYDYRVLIGEMVLEEFYRPFVRECRRLGALSRVQCHGAPTDIVAAYAEADIPESEALLFDPEFSRFAASAAAITGKNIVSCETFTCLYGWNPWPAGSPRLGEEKIGDLRLLADSLAAHGVNRYVWHGMPSRASGRGDRFYASVHVGPDGALAPFIASLNTYLESLSAHMREGRPVFGLACLLPLEDVRMKGELPEELRKPSARSWWELQHRCLPETLKPWSPLWVTAGLLRDAHALPAGALRIGEVQVPALVVDCEFLESSTLEQLVRLAAEGARIIMTGRPREPGRRRHGGYERLVDSLTAGPEVRLSRDPRESLGDAGPILRRGEGFDFFVRKTGDDFLVFAAHPRATGLTYPMEYGRSSHAVAESRRVRLALPGGPEVDCELDFGAGEGVLLRVTGSGATGSVPLPAVAAGKT